MSASIKTAISSLRFPRPAPIPPGSTHRRARSDTRLVTGGELTYDHFAFLRARASEVDHNPPYALNEAAMVKRGFVNLQKDTLRNFSWTRKVWLVLEENALHVCPKEDTPPVHTIFLNQVVRIERIDDRRCCFAVSTNVTTWFLLFKDITSLNEWFHVVRIRCPLLYISHPTGFQHTLHVTYDPAAGEITGLPEPWIATLASWGVQSSTTGLADPAPPQTYIPQSDPGYPSRSTPSLSPLRPPPPAPVRPYGSSSRSWPSPDNDPKRHSGQTGTSSTTLNSNRHSSSNRGSTPNSSVPSPTSSMPKQGQPGPQQPKPQLQLQSPWPPSQPWPLPPPPSVTLNRSRSNTIGGLSRSSAEEDSVLTDRPQSVVPSLGASVGAFRKSPQVFRDVEARNLTGSVQPSHLLPSSRNENCDIWKGEWTGGFGKRKVDIHIIRLSPLTLPSETPALRDTIFREVKALHQLRHPNVVRIRGYAMDEEDRYGWGPLPGLVETWTANGNVMEWLEYKRPVVGKIERLRILCEAAAGLNYLHSFSREIVHGNFRGLHILLTENNVARISGYGINPVLSQMTFDPYAAASEISPAPRWASFEAFAKGRRTLNAASDVWSYARTVLEVMTGRHPFEYITDDAEVIPFVLRNILPRRPPVFSTPALMPDAAPLWPFLERCWADDGAKRPTMAAVLVKMEEVLAWARQSGDNDACVPAPKSMAG